MNYAALCFWLLIAWSVTASHGTLLVLLVASMPFASLALLPPERVHISILPQSMFAVVLILKVLAPQLMPLSPKLLTVLRLRHLGFLAFFFLVGTVATVFMPKLFAGEVFIISMKEAFRGPDLLSSTLQNFTQLGYVALSVAAVFAVTLMADERQFAKTLLISVLGGSIVCVVTGLIDLAAASTGMESLLQPFRNADYAYLTAVEIAGQRRVVGFTPEASAYGPICVNFAAAILLLRPLFTEGPQRVLATTIGIVLVWMAVLSTSSTAYLGLAVFGLVYSANWVRRAAFSSPFGWRGLWGELLICLAAIAAMLFVLIANADLFSPLLNTIDEIIFKKPLSGSFYERSLWNTTAWETIAATWGLGVGFGSTRTSNWVAAIVSNAGLIGAAFMALFLFQTFASRPMWRTAWSRELLVDLKLSLLPALALLAISSPGPDFGLWVGVVFGAIAGIAAFRPRRRSTDHVDEYAPERRLAARVIDRTARARRGPTRPAPRPSF